MILNDYADQKSVRASEIFREHKQRLGQKLKYYRITTYGSKVKCIQIQC